MIFRRSYRTRSAAPCQTCTRIRTFLTVSAVLIIAIPLIGEKAAALAKIKPMEIALAIMGLGFVGFIIRLIAWRKEEAQDRKKKIL